MLAFDWYRDGRGQALVETALIIPILLFLIMGIFVIGYWMNALQVVTSAAREGARIGALTGKGCAISYAVTNTMNIIDTNTAHTKLEVPNPLPNLGETLTIKVTYDIPLNFSFFQSTYEAGNPQATFPFKSVVGQASSFMETGANSEPCLGV